MKYHLTLLTACLLSQFAIADAKNDVEMKKLASASGCMTCHGIETSKPGPNGLKPIGPAWSEVAKQYKGKPGATEFLTRVVLEARIPTAATGKTRSAASRCHPTRSPSPKAMPVS